MILGPDLAGYTQELYVGANCHPHNSDPETWARDIQLMQQVRFRVVRMGHLACRKLPTAPSLPAREAIA
ncbi:MAG TPA: hypothetical protein VIK53_09860 [Verrucomicrobiae bacterium]